MYNALQTIQAFEAGQGQRKERERERTMQGVGNALAGGNYSGAAGLAFNMGDIGTGMQLQQYGKGLEDAAAEQKRVGAIRYGMGLLNTPAEQREAMRGQIGQTLGGMGWQLDDQAIASMDLSDEGIKATLATLQDTDSLMAQYQSMMAPAEYGFQNVAGVGLVRTDPRGGTADVAMAAVRDPIEVNGVLVDPVTYEPIRDFRTPAQTGEMTAYQQEQLRLEAARLGISEAELMLKLEQAAAGPEINVDDEGQLRREYNTITKEFRDVQSAFGRIQATDAATPAGQLSLVFQYMKMLDPGSTVREGEFANAENARGVPSSVANTYNSIMQGKRLTPKQVEDFKGQAQNLYGQALGSYDTTRKTYEGIATQYGFPTDRTVPDLATMRDFKPKTFLERGMSMLPGGTEPIADEDPEIDSLLQKYGVR